MARRRAAPTPPPPSRCAPRPMSRPPERSAPPDQPRRSRAPIPPRRASCRTHAPPSSARCASRPPAPAAPAAPETPIPAPAARPSRRPVASGSPPARAHPLRQAIPYSKAASLPPTARPKEKGRQNRRPPQNSPRLRTLNTRPGNDRGSVQAEPKSVIAEQRSAACSNAREHRSAGNRALQARLG